MTPTLNVTHRAGDPCPSDMFVVTPPEAFIGAHFQRDVEVVGDRAPYLVRYDGTTDEQGAPIRLDTRDGIRCTIDGGGLCIEDVGASRRWAGIQLNDGDTTRTGTAHDYGLAV